MWRYEGLETLQNVVSGFCSSQGTEKAAGRRQPENSVWHTHKGSVPSPPAGPQKAQNNPIPSNKLQRLDLELEVQLGGEGLAELARSPGFHPQHHINQAW